MYRACEAHYLSEGSPCPVCEIERLKDRLADTDRLHSATASWKEEEIKWKATEARLKARAEELEKKITQSRTLLGEGVHTMFRKGIDAPGSMMVWNFIKDLPDEKWAAAIDWLWRGLGFTEIGGKDEHHITDEQIDAAWEHVGVDSPEAAEDALECFHITRCKDCDGRGYLDQEPVTSGAYPNQQPRCTACNGHGWKIGGGGE